MRFITVLLLMTCLATQCIAEVIESFYCESGTGYCCDTLTKGGLAKGCVIARARGGYVDTDAHHYPSSSVCVFRTYKKSVDQSACCDGNDTYVTPTLQIKDCRRPVGHRIRVDRVQQKITFPDGDTITMDEYMRATEALGEVLGDSPGKVTWNGNHGTLNSSMSYHED